PQDDNGQRQGNPFQAPRGRFSGCNPRPKAQRARHRLDHRDNGFHEKNNDQQKSTDCQQQWPAVNGKFVIWFGKWSTYGAGAAFDAAIAQVTIKLKATAGTDGHLVLPRIGSLPRIGENPKTLVCLTQLGSAEA